MPTLRPMTGIYLLHGEKILMLHRKGSRVVDGLWVSSAGGHMEPHELNDPTACVLREMHEELALTPDVLEDFSLRYVSLRFTGGEVRENYYFFARLPQELPLTSAEGELRWVLLDEVMALEMPFSARYMLAHYLHTGRFTSQLYAGVSDGDTVHFIDMKG